MALGWFLILLFLAVDYRLVLGYERNKLGISGKLA